MRVIFEPEEGDVVTHPDQVGWGEMEAIRKVMEECINLQQRKGFAYGSAWRDQGYMGNVGRVLSKASRLRNMVWRNNQIEDAEESVADTLRDLINLAAFAMINMRLGNKWGDGVQI
jgi:hypothetical protein